MNGLFFELDPATYNPSLSIPSREAKYLSHYNNTWVLSKEPTPHNTNYGAADEWEALFDLNTQAWLPVPVKQLDGTITEAKIVDVNVVGPFVDYVVQYTTDEKVGEKTRQIFFRDRNVDGVFSTADYSVFNNQMWDESIIGPYDENQTYIKLFNNSVILYALTGFNLRAVINGTQTVNYSCAPVPDRIGVCLVPFGDFEDDFLPTVFEHEQKRYVIIKTSTGFIRIIRLGTDVPNRIERIGQYIHKINTIDTINILVEREDRITVEPGSLDWNNKFEIVNGALPGIAQEKFTYHVNSAYNPLYEISGLRSSSMIVDNTRFTLYGQLTNLPIANRYTLRFFNASLNSGDIDVFYDSVSPAKYRYSIINGITRFNSRYEELDFPDGVIVPFPIGTEWSMQNDLVAVGLMSKELLAVGLINGNKTLAIYEYSNQIYFGRDAFSLFGVQYIYDGDYIYQGEDRVAMAFGYIFVGCDPNAAYFYNPWDKSVYQFTGSRSLSRFMNLSNRSEVKVGRYDGFSGEMVLLTEDEILKSRDNVIMDFPYRPGNNIISTKKGPYVTLEDESRLLLTPKDGEIDTFEVVTGFIGVDGSTVCDFERIDIRLDSQNRKPMVFTVEMQTINQDTKESEQKHIEIKTNDWSSDGYKTIKLIPQYKKGTGLSLRVFSEESIDIDSIDFTYNPVARTANSQRSGY